MKQAVQISVLAISFGIFLLSLIMYFNITNKEIRLRNQISAQEQNIESYYDKMFKILKQKAGVTDEYKNSFKDIYVEIMEGRYSQGDGSLMKWIQESNPNFDASLYKDLMASIEIEREGFHNEQKKIIDQIREHNNMIETFPSRIFLSNIEHIKYEVISSTLSKNVMETRIEDDIALFD